MPEDVTVSEESPTRKRGLHGWRAFFAVFGCGTLAALVVFGSIYGVIRAAVGSFSDQSTSPQSGVGMEPKPMETLDVETIEACKRVQSFSLLRANPANLLTEEGENYRDENLGELGRVISDSCRWDVSPPEGSADWVFTFSFDAYVEAPSDSTMEEASGVGYQEKIEEVKDQYDSVEFEGDASRGSATAEYFYGTLGADDEGPTYTAVAQARNAVYVIQVQDVTDSDLRLGDPTSVDEFHGASALTIERMATYFERLLPDDV